MPEEHLFQDGTLSFLQARLVECAGIQGGAKAFWSAIDAIFAQSAGNGGGLPGGTLILQGGVSRRLPPLAVGGLALAHTGSQLLQAFRHHLVGIDRNCQDPGNAHFTHLEDVHFTYRKITWTHEVSGTSGSDDWRSLLRD